MKKILLLNSFVILTNFVLGQSNTCGTNAVSNCSNPDQWKNLGISI